MFRLIKMLFCKHDYRFKINFYGDQIIAHNFKRSWWICPKCGLSQFRRDLHEPDKPFSFTIQEPTGPF